MVNILLWISIKHLLHNTENFNNNTDIFHFTYNLVNTQLGLKSHLWSQKPTFSLKTHSLYQNFDLFSWTILVLVFHAMYECSKKKESISLSRAPISRKWQRVCSLILIILDSCTFCNGILLDFAQLTLF